MRAIENHQTIKSLTVGYGNPGAVHGGVGQDTGAQLLPAPVNRYFIYVKNNHFLEVKKI